MHDGHRPTVVARLLHQLAGLLQILLGQPLGAGLGRVGAVAGEDRIAGAVVLRLADPGLQIQVLVHHGDQRLPGLLVVERRMQVVRAQPALGAEGIGQERRQGGVLLDLRYEVDRRDLPPVHLARRQRGGGGRRIGDVAPDDLVEMDLLAPGRSARRLVARHVVGVLHIDDLVARLPLVLHEAERPRSHDLLDLLVRGGARDTGRHHERDVARRLADRLQHGPEALAQLERERLAVHGRNLGGVGGQQPAKAVLLHPALERFGAILGDHGLPVMPLEPVTQGERVFHAITRDGMLVHHLRLDLELLVGAKQCVVDQVGVVAGDIRGGPHRVQDLEVGLGDEAQGPATLLGVDTGGREGRGRDAPRGRGEELTTTHWAHRRPSSGWRVVLHGEAAAIVARPPGGGRWPDPRVHWARLWSIGPSGPRRSIRPRRRWVFRLLGREREAGRFKETVHGSETFRRWPAFLDVKRPAP